MSYSWRRPPKEARKSAYPKRGQSSESDEKMFFGDEFQPSSGYAFRSSQRYPRDPETVMLNEGEANAVWLFVGYAIIDSLKHCAFKAKYAVTSLYVFQLPQSVRRKSRG